MKHYFNEGEEYLKKDGANFQGKSIKQYEDSAKILVGAAAITAIMLVVAIIQHLIFLIF